MLGNLLKEKGRCDFGDELTFYSQWFSTFKSGSSDDMFLWKHCSPQRITIPRQVLHELNRPLWAGPVSLHHVEHFFYEKMCSKFPTTDLQMNFRIVSTHKTGIIYIIPFIHKGTSQGQSQICAYISP